MPDKKRHLITTADERTWKFDCPVIFLGEWCQLYNRRHIWGKMDFIGAEPFGLDHMQRDRDDEICREVEDELVIVAADILNKFHGVEHSYRYWRIIFGHWLRAYVDLIFNRYKTLQLCLEKYNIESTICINDESFNLATSDTKSFYFASNDDVWNNVLYSKLLLFFDSESIDKTTIENGSSYFTKEPSSLKSSFIKNTLFSFLKIFAKESDAIIASTYLPYWEEIKLKLAYKQVPIRYDHPTLCFSRPNLMFRRKLSDTLLTDDKTGFFKCVRNMLFEMMPTCFLEDYKMMSAVVEKLNWPSKPRFIFTSNNYFYDEVFKFVTAEKVEMGTPYYVGQHGNYGTNKTNYPTVEMLTCDKYLKWGSATLVSQEVPTFVLKLANKKAIVPDRNGNLLFIQDLQGNRNEIWDNTQRYILSMNRNFSFYNQLYDKIKTSAIIRLHSAIDFYRQYEHERWQDVDRRIKINVNSSLDTLLGNSRVTVFSYNSAGFLENLCQNIPTLVLIDDIYFIGDIARPYYKYLADMGIVHFSSTSAAQKVNTVWDNIDAWWMSSEIQDIRKQFCDKFARQSVNSISDLMKILT